MLQILVTCVHFLFGYKNWDSSLSTETGYIQDGQSSLTSKGSVFSVCHDIHATLVSTHSPPLHTAKQPPHGTVHHSTTHTCIANITFAIILWISSMYFICLKYGTPKSNNTHVYYLHWLIKNVLVVFQGIYGKMESSVLHLHVVQNTDNYLTLRNQSLWWNVQLVWGTILPTGSVLPVQIYLLAHKDNWCHAQLHHYHQTTLWYRETFPGKYVTSDAEILVMGMLHNLHLPHLYQNKHRNLLIYIYTDIFYTQSTPLLVPCSKTAISFMKVPDDGQVIPDSPRPLTFVDQNALQPAFQKCSIIRSCLVTQALVYLKVFLGQCGWGISSSRMWCNITPQKKWYPSPTFLCAVWRRFCYHSNRNFQFLLSFTWLNMNMNPKASRTIC